MLRNINFKIFVLIILSFGCNSELDEKLPEDIIQPSVMKSIIFDMNLAETKMLRMNLDDDAQIAQREADLDFILKKHQISDSLFNRSYSFYSKSPNHFKEVLEGAIEMVDEKNFILQNEDSLSRTVN